MFEENDYVMTQEELAEYQAEYNAWLDEHPEFSEYLDEVFSADC